MAITVISYAPVGHSYFHTPPAASCHPRRFARGCREATGAYDTNLTVTGAYDHFAGSVICANIYIIAMFLLFLPHCTAKE